MSLNGMLSVLRIENLAIVDHAELQLGAGLTVLSGETGAGKSILVDALGLVLGGRSDSELVRAGASEAVVEGLFVVPEGSMVRARLEKLGIEAPGGELIVRRVLGRSGRGRVTINGQMATVAMLTELMRGMVDVSGQHEHVSLLDVEQHLSLLDAFGGHGALVDDYGAAHRALLAVDAALSSLQLDESEKARREDFLRFQLDEIATVNPAPGELERLEADRRRLQHAGRLAEAARRAEGQLYSEDGAAVEALGRVHVELSQLVRLDDRLAPLVAAAAASLAEVEDLAQSVGRYARSLDADPGRLAEVDERVEALRRLMRKHGGTLEGVLAARERMAVELDAIVHQETRRTELIEARERAVVARSTAAAALSARRTEAAAALERRVQAELASLSMGGTQLSVALVALETPGPRGAERVDLCFAPNRGEPLRPLAKTASGGELSRLLLAFKRVLAERDAVGSYVFDEVDTGIGGAVAEVLGRKLAEVARGRQALCITHLPQVAAYGDRHLYVRKEEHGGRTVSRVVELREDEVVEALARMLGGVEITDRSRRLAEEMLERARADVANMLRDPAAERRGARAAAARPVGSAPPAPAAGTSVTSGGRGRKPPRSVSGARPSPVAAVANAAAPRRPQREAAHGRPGRRSS